MSRSRSYVFTLNNYTEEDEHQCIAMQWEPGCVYFIAGREVAPETGTRHLQGLICFSTLKSLSQLRSYYPSAHFEEKRGTFAQAADYCKKEGDYFEWGTLPLDQTAKGESGGLPWAEALQCVREGRIADVPECMTHMIKHCEYRVAKERMQSRNISILDGDLDHEWWYGPPGTGKTSKVHADYPDLFIKDPKERWWCSYVGQDVVLIDDFDKYQLAMAGDIKRWLDRYPFQAPVKGGYQLIRPRKIIITSNYHPDEIWEDVVTQEAIKRRVKIVHFPKTIFHA